MNKLVKLLLSALIVFFVSGCGESDSTGASNKYLNEAPGIAQNYTVKIDELENEKENATDFEELTELSKELEELENEAELKIEKIAKSIPLPINVPYEGNVNVEEYKVNELQITNLRYNDIELTAKITSKVTRSHIFGYLQALDSEGNVLQSNDDWAVLAVSNWRDLKEGEQATMKGYFRGLEKLENLEKFVFKSREEWDKYN